MAWTTATERVLQFDAEVWGREVGTTRVARNGDHEFYIVFTIRARDASNTLALLDVSGVGSATLVAIDPAGQRYRYAMADRTDGTDGVQQYQVADGEMEDAGEWQLFCELAFGTSIVSTNRQILHVEGAGYRAPEKKNGDLTGEYLIDVAAGNVDGASLVRKFGRNLDVDTSAETVWTAGGVYAFPAAAQVLDVVSADNDDGAGAGTGALTLELQGLNAAYQEIKETVTLNGVTPVSTTAAFLRCHRAIVRTAGGTGSNEGIITIDQTTSGTVVGQIAVGANQTQLALFTIPEGKTGYMLGLVISATKLAAAASVDVSMYFRPLGEAFQLKGTYGNSTASSDTIIKFQAPPVIAAKTDIRFDAVSTTNNAQVAVEFPILLIDESSG